MDRQHLLQLREKELKWMLTGVESEKDAHRLNVYDKHHLPEYAPYALESKEFNIVELYAVNETLVNKNTLGQYYHTGFYALDESPYETKEQFEQVYKRDKTSSTDHSHQTSNISVYLELSDKNSDAK